MLPGTLALLLALLALAAAVAPALQHWQRRRAWASAAPRRLLEPAPRADALAALALLLALAAVLLGRPAGLTPLTTLLAAYAVFIVGHRRGSPAIGALGLALVACTLASASLNWLPQVGFNLVLGLVAAARLLQWFAIFWHQQLLRGEGWTTTGTLTPWSELLSYFAVLSALLAFALAPGPFSERALAPALLALLLLSLLVGFFLHTHGPDARLERREAARLAAWIMLAMAGLPLSVLLSVVFGWEVNPLLLAALVPAGVLLSRLRTA